MVTERIIISPRRDEVIIDGNGVSQPRFINYLEDITTEVQEISKDIINLEGTTTIVVSGTYQTNGNTVVICDGPAIITLDPTPTDGTKVSVKRTNGEVTVKSDTVNIVNISEESAIILSRNGVNLEFVYLSSSQLWYIV